MLKFDEGYIKFKLDWSQKEFDLRDELFYEITDCRNKLFNLGLIGSYPNGIGFGNISIRNKNSDFIISGSATGEIKDLTKAHYALVNDFNILKNSVRCIGLIKASSESLSHAAIYESNSKVNAIIHVHHKEMWEKYRDNLLTTDPKAEFGTPEMALEIKKLANQESGIIIMAGHPEGIIVYGNGLSEAEELLLKYYNNI